MAVDLKRLHLGGCVSLEENGSLVSALPCSFCSDQSGKAILSGRLFIQFLCFAYEALTCNCLPLPYFTSIPESLLHQLPAALSEYSCAVQVFIHNASPQRFAL